MIYSIHQCQQCPFLRPVNETEGKCSVATPRDRGMILGEGRPKWCLLIREQVIVREAEKK